MDRLEIEVQNITQKTIQHDNTIRTQRNHFEQFQRERQTRWNQEKDVLNERVSQLINELKDRETLYDTILEQFRTSLASLEMTCRR